MHPNLEREFPSRLRLACSVLAGLIIPMSAQAAASTASSAAGYPDISAYTPDLEPPGMTTGPPAAGRRVRATLAAYRNTEVYYALYLPPDWKPGRRYPVIVEYAGNGDYRSRHGDVCTGRVEDSSLGYGLTGGIGSIWVCLPYVDTANRRNALRWWGDLAATVDFCKEAVRTVCAEFGGDPQAVFICGFSRGALACNYVGLHDDDIASLWRGFFVASHYDGAREWAYPASDRASALARLVRLGRRPVFISQEVYGIEPETYNITHTINYLAGTGRPLDNFHFQIVPLRNHTDRWVLYDLPARRSLREWYREALARPPATTDRPPPVGPRSGKRD